MRKPNKNKMAGVNSRFASVSESIFNGFLLKMLLRSLPVYILKQLFFSISVNSGRIFTSPLRGSVNILPLFTSISKNNCQLFERLFKVKKNGVFLLGISFFFLEIFTFSYYANEERDDVIYRNIGAVFFKLGTKKVHHKRNRMTPTMLLPWHTLGSSLLL